MPPLASMAARADEVNAWALTVCPLAVYSDGPLTTFLSVYLVGMEGTVRGRRRGVARGRRQRGGVREV